MVEDLREGWPRTLKVGDKVVVRSHSSTWVQIGFVTKVTATGQMDVVVKDATEAAIRFSPKGRSGTGGWYDFRLGKATQEAEDTIKRQNLLNAVTETAYEKLTTDQLERMAAIVRESALDGARSRSDV